LVVLLHHDRPARTARARWDYPECDAVHRGSPRHSMVRQSPSTSRICGTVLALRRRRVDFPFPTSLSRLRRTRMKLNETAAMTAESLDRASIIVWVWLVGLLGAGMMVFMLPIPRIPALLLIFGIAAFKATLVLRDYMHLKGEKLLI